MANKAQRFLIENRLDDLTLNRGHLRGNTPENAKKWVYASDAMMVFLSANTKEKLDSVVFDSEIKEAFKGTDFGSGDKRKILWKHLKDMSLGYGSGSTIEGISLKLGLRVQSNLTKRGFSFLMENHV